MVVIGEDEEDEAVKGSSYLLTHSLTHSVA